MAGRSSVAGRRAATLSAALAALAGGWLVGGWVTRPPQPVIVARDRSRAPARDGQSVPVESIPRHESPDVGEPRRAPRDPGAEPAEATTASAPVLPGTAGSFHRRGEAARLWVGQSDWSSRSGDGVFTALARTGERPSRAMRELSDALIDRARRMKPLGAAPWDDDVFQLGGASARRWMIVGSAFSPLAGPEATVRSASASDDASSRGHRFESLVSELEALEVRRREVMSRILVRACELASERRFETRHDIFLVEEGVLRVGDSGDHADVAVELAKGAAIDDAIDDRLRRVIE